MGATGQHQAIRILLAKMGLDCHDTADVTLA